jgi:adenylate cyclase
MERRLTTILSADIVGYSRLMAVDDVGTLAQLNTHRKEVLEPKIAEFAGRVVKLMGDGTLMEFGSVVDAVKFAVNVQRSMAKRNIGVPEDRQITYRIGINIGDIIVEGDDIFGDGVNVAARLEALAEPGGICISQSVHSQIEGKVELKFEDLGEQQVKNIPKPVKVFQVLLAAPAADHGAFSATKTKRAMRWPVVVGVLAALSIVVGIAIWQRPWAPWEPHEEPVTEANMAFPLPDRPSIAVLPFTNMSGDANQEYFTDGMTEDLITDLSNISGLFVIARNSSFSYKGKQVKVRQVALDLGVRYVLEGSVRRVGEQVRINAQLIDATTGGHIWAERYDGALTNIFALQDKVTQQIVQALSVNLTAVEQKLQTRNETKKPKAHDAFLQGWAYFKLGTRENLAKAAQLFESAIQLDPDYARAHALLATIYWDALKNDWTFELGLLSFEAESKADEHLMKALKSPGPIVHALQSRILAASQRYGEAVREAQKAVALDTNDATAYAGLAHALILADRAEEGAKAIRRAMRLDPHHPPGYLIILGATQFGVQQYKAAAKTFERAVRLNPDNELPLIYLAASFGHLGLIKQADAAIQAANDLRHSQNLGFLSLENTIVFATGPLNGGIDFTRFGGKSVQDRVRAGLRDIPALKWQYLVTVHRAQIVPGQEDTWWEVKGVTTIDATKAKSMYDQGVVFIYTDDFHEWKAGRIPKSVHLQGSRTKVFQREIFNEATLAERVDKNQEVVIYAGTFEGVHGEPAYASARAFAWGFSRVHYFTGGLRDWNKAGYPIAKDK